VLQRVPNSGGTQITLSDDTVTVGRYGESLVFKNTEMIIADDRNGANGAAVNLTVNIDTFVGYFEVPFLGGSTGAAYSIKLNGTVSSEGYTMYLSPYLSNQYFNDNITDGNTNDYFSDSTVVPMLNITANNFTLGVGVGLQPVDVNNADVTFFADPYQITGLDGKELQTVGNTKINNVGDLTVVIFDENHKADGTFFNVGDVQISLYKYSNTEFQVKFQDPNQPGKSTQLLNFRDCDSITIEQATYADQLKAEEMLMGDPKFDSENETEEEKNLAMMDYRYQMDVNRYYEMFSDFDDELNVEEEVVVEESLNNNVAENVVVDENSNNENIDENNGGENSNIWLDGLHDRLENFAENHPNIVNKIENIMDNDGFLGIGSGILIDNNFDGVNIEGAFDKIGQIDNYLKDILDGKYSEVMKSLKDVLENASDYNKSVLKDFANNIFENIVHKNNDYNSENIFVSAKEREEAKNENTMDENYQQKQDENNLAFEDFSDDAKNSLVEENQTEEVSAKKDDSLDAINLKDIFDALDSSSLSGKDGENFAENNASSNNVTHNISEDSLQIDLAEYSLEHAIKSDASVGDDSAEKLHQQNKKSNSNLGGY